MMFSKIFWMMLCLLGHDRIGAASTGKLHTFRVNNVGHFQLGRSAPGISSQECSEYYSIYV